MECLAAVVVFACFCCYSHCTMLWLLEMYWPRVGKHHVMYILLEITQHHQLCYFQEPAKTHGEHIFSDKALIWETEFFLIIFWVFKCTSGRRIFKEIGNVFSASFLKKHNPPPFFFPMWRSDSIPVTLCCKNTCFSQGRSYNFLRFLEHWRK